MSDTVYVIQRGTNRIFVATDKLLERDDMTLIDKKTIDIRIEATKRLLEEKKSLLLVKRGAGVPQEIEDGADALNKLQGELAETNREIADMDKKEEKADPNKEPEDIKEANEKAFQELVDNDNEIKSIKGMRKAKAVADYLAANYGIKKEGYKQADVDKLKEEAIQKRTETLTEQFNK